MKSLVSILFVICCAAGVWAQTAKSQRPALPADVSQWNGRMSDIILQNPVVVNRLNRLLGKKNYADFMESWETVNPVVKNGKYLFSSGCLIHACGHLESAIAIDPVNQTLHVAIFREREKTRFFNERKRQTPPVLKNWATRLAKK
jgi:hypothetical protein